MDKAIEIAASAYDRNKRDVPVGCVIVRDGQILSSGHNTRERSGLVTGHAEINALNEAASILGTRRLNGCKLFVTLEPCPMCAGAIRASHIDELYFGAYNMREGAAGSVYNIVYPDVKVFGGIRKSDCESLLKEFFASIRL